MKSNQSGIRVQTDHNEPELARLSSGFFSIASQISDAITQFRAARLITTGFGESESKLKLLQLMAALNKARLGPDGCAVKGAGGAST